jgi:hypothetical protein
MIGTARAHDDATMNAMVAPHGGQLRMAGGLHVELVIAKDSNSVKENAVTVYLTDHAGVKVPSAGRSAMVTLLYANSKATSVLTPDGDNRLSGRAVYASLPDIKAVVNVITPGQPAQQARFTPLAPDAQGAIDHKH